ncbi:MAG TPA: histidine phosphatase family protein [Myxococcota bacterium]|nr:histidine phosphatase family protein [Myxococcota bacterium]
MSRLLLVRHCQSSGQHPDAALTEAGHVQAHALAERLCELPIDRIVASSYRRARATLAPLAGRLGLDLELDDRLVERRLSPAPIDHWREVVERSFSEPDFCVPGGESGRETLERGWKALEAIFDAGHTLPVVASHGQLISIVLHRIDPSFGFAGWQGMANPDLFWLERDAGGRVSWRRSP